MLIVKASRQGAHVDGYARKTQEIKMEPPIYFFDNTCLHHEQSPRKDARSNDARVCYAPLNSAAPRHNVFVRFKDITLIVKRYTAKILSPPPRPLLHTRTAPHATPPI